MHHDSHAQVQEKGDLAVLFVCLGNICRSPLAQGIFTAVMRERQGTYTLLIDSAGTGAWHAGSAPDPRSIDIARRHGIDISSQRARRIEEDDFDRFDLILGMDRSNVETLRSVAPRGAAGRIHLFCDVATGSGTDIPDPYYGGAEGFDAVYRMIRDAAASLADRLADPRLLSMLRSGQASSTI